MPHTVYTKKVAIFHAFFIPKGGGEKLMFDIRDQYHADLFCGALDSQIWDKSKSQTDSFVAQLYDPQYKFVSLHEENHIPIWRKVVRQWNFLTSKKIELLLDYDLIIFSGNIGIVPRRIKQLAKKRGITPPRMVMYCHTPPRPFTDQLQHYLSKINPILRPLAKLFSTYVVGQYRKDSVAMDLIVSNSKNTQNRLKTFVGLDSIPIYPAVNTHRFSFIGQQDYYLSYARIEPLKRIPLIVDAFAKMPEKKLIIASVGPLANWLKEEITKRNLTNIVYEGLVTDARLSELVGSCIAGIYIPVDEDAGMTQCELMSAGKPVVGVNEGGLTETIIDRQTGILIPANPSVDDLILAIQTMTPEYALSLRKQSEIQGKKFDKSAFFEQLDTELDNIL